MTDLKGRVAIITGAGRGIGAATARHFASLGASLVLNDLGTGTDGTGADSGPAQTIADEIIAGGGKAVADGGDIAETSTGERLVDLALENYGKLDIVVNIAGILRDKMIFNLPEEDWDAVIRVHLRGHYSTIKPAAAYWRKQRNPDGNYRIINFTSDSALQGSPGQPNYAAAKMGVVGLTYSLANGLSRYGVTANAIAPAAATRLTSTVPDGKKVTVGNEPSTNQPENIAPVVGYVASTRSSWLSGRVLGAGGHKVKLWSNPTIVETIESDGPWAPENIADSMESVFRPNAEGLHPSAFMSQLVTK